MVLHCVDSGDMVVIASRHAKTAETGCPRVAAPRHGPWGSRVRRLLCQLAARRMGYEGAEVTRYLGANTWSVPPSRGQ